MTGAGDHGRALVRLVATDLDGTIVRHDGTVSARVVEAIAAVEALGLPVVFVTGRPPRWMEAVVGVTELHGIAICANGAIVYDIHNDRVLERFELEPAVAIECVRRLRDALPAAAFAAEDVEGFYHERAYIPRWPGAGAGVFDTAEDMLARPVAKLLVRDETSTGDAMLEVARPLLADLVTVTHSNQRDCLLEISAAGVTKASTLAKVAAELGVDASGVLAFGDQPNDVAMLEWAGLAYAMGGGHPEALAAVPLHAEPVAADGVALVLEALIADGTIARP